MSEENQEEERPKRNLRNKLDRKFGVSEEPKDRGDRLITPNRGDRPASNDRGARPYSNDLGDRPAFNDRGDRGARPFSNDRGDRGARPFSNDRAGRPAFNDRGDRPAFNDRGDRGARPYSNDRGSRPAFNDRGDRPYSNDRGDRPFGGANEERPYFRQRPASAEPLAENRPFLEGEPALGIELDRDPPWFRKILGLATEKGREREEMFLAEGFRVALEMVEYHPDLIDGIYVSPSFAEKTLIDKANEANIRIHTLEEAQIARLSTTVTSPGVVAVCRSASLKPDYGMAHMLTMIDAVQDPGNLGAIFRTSLGFGFDGVLLGKGSVNPFNPKVVRGSSGTFLRVPFEHGVDLSERMQFLRQKGFTIIATDLHAKSGIADIPPRKLRKVALLMGNEGAGADPKIIEQADHVVRIPMAKTLESLNVAVAHGILAYQVATMREA